MLVWVKMMKPSKWTVLDSKLSCLLWIFMSLILYIHISSQKSGNPVICIVYYIYTYVHIVIDISFVCHDPCSYLCIYIYSCITKILSISISKIIYNPFPRILTPPKKKHLRTSGSFLLLGVFSTRVRRFPLILNLKP